MRQAVVDGVFQLLRKPTIGRRETGERRHRHIAGPATTIAIRN